MKTDNLAELPFFRLTWSYNLRWLTSIAAAVITAILVFDATAGAAQRMAWLIEKARPACTHSGITNAELHALASEELDLRTSKKDALRALVTLCQARLANGMSL